MDEKAFFFLFFFLQYGKIQALSVELRLKNQFCNLEQWEKVLRCGEKNI